MLNGNIGETTTNGLRLFCTQIVTAYNSKRDGIGNSWGRKFMRGIIAN
jgi:hypothetical protein